MCKGSGHCGWGEALEPFWHKVLCVLTDLSKDGLWVNHYTWTWNNSNHAHCVATWDRYTPGNGYAWEIECCVSTVMCRGAVCTVNVYKEGTIQAGA